MFFDKANTKKILDLEEEISRIKRELQALKLDLELYVRKLKASKGIKPVKEQLEKDIYKGVLLPEDGII